MLYEQNFSRHLCKCLKIKIPTRLELEPRLLLPVRMLFIILPNETRERG